MLFNYYLYYADACIQSTQRTSFKLDTTFYIMHRSGTNRVTPFLCPFLRLLLLLMHQPEPLQDILAPPLCSLVSNPNSVNRKWGFISIGSRAHTSENARIIGLDGRRGLGRCYLNEQNAICGADCGHIDFLIRCPERGSCVRLWSTIEKRKLPPICVPHGLWPSFNQHQQYALESVRRRSLLCTMMIGEANTHILECFCSDWLIRDRSPKAITFNALFAS